MGPVRVGNQAADQLQHDAYGSIILGAAQMFIDERLPRMGDEGLFRRLEPLGHQAARFVKEPDAGIWEYRGRQRVHTHSATMCWAACDRLCAHRRIARHRRIAEAYWCGQAEDCRSSFSSAVEREERRPSSAHSITTISTPACCCSPSWDFISANDPRFIKTVEMIGKELNRGGYIMRYTASDDFGEPETAFLVCQFWYIDALDDDRPQGRGARAVQSSALAPQCVRHPVGGHRAATGEIWGNLPQTYSMAGIINTGMNLSRRWDEAWASD